MSSSKRATINENNPLASLSDDLKSEPTSGNGQSEAKPKPQKKSQVRPGYRQTTIVLPKEQLKWLAEAALRSTNDDGIVSNKTTIIKALIDVARDVRLDLSGIKSEEEIAERLIEAVKARF